MAKVGLITIAQNYFGLVAKTEVTGNTAN